MLFKKNTIIGHRGCLLVGQNNTVEAYLKAIEVGAEMVEMDVRKTRDGVMIVWHDPAIEGRRIRGTLYEDLIFAANEAGKIVPRFEDVLKALEGKIMIDVELKETGYEEDVVSLILKYFTPSEFVVTTFLDGEIAKLKKQFPTVKCGLILGIGGENELAKKGFGKIKQRLSEIFPWRRVRNCGADFIVPHWKLLALGMAKKAYKKGIPVFTWTVDDEKLVTRLMSEGHFNGIITNRPDMAIKIRNDL